MNIKLEYETINYGYEDRTELVVYVDDKEFYRGNYGGEPEDNSHYRDYSWVRDAMKELCTLLGANVVLSDKKVKGEF